MLTIDGSQGEGGGQILRTALALSMVTGTPFRIERIRAGRARPGLMRQHLAAVNAAAEISRAKFSGASVGSQELSFAPGAVRPGHFHFAIGTAGSTTLVLQTVLPALLTLSGPSTIVLEGGTHNLHAPPFDFLAKSFIPLINRMGPNVSVTLERRGFYPAGGGRFSVVIAPGAALRPMDLIERGPILRRTARAVVAGLPRHIAERELHTLARLLGWPTTELKVEEDTDARGPGNVVLIEIESEHVTEVFTAFGERGLPAEAVARKAVADAQRYLAAGTPVGAHLADQLLLPFALVGSGSFKTLEPSRHALTNAEIVRMFLAVDVSWRQIEADLWAVEVRPGSRSSEA